VAEDVLVPLAAIAVGRPVKWIESRTEYVAIVQRGDKPPYRPKAVSEGDIADTTLANVALGYQRGSFIPIEVVARKR
jgi:CO/xanthine dehydrogenase Mo-binding subunit